MSSKYVYIRSRPDLWTVGFYDPRGRWYPESVHSSADKAANRVHWLNGGEINDNIKYTPEELEALDEMDYAEERCKEEIRKNRWYNRFLASIKGYCRIYK